MAIRSARYRACRTEKSLDFSGMLSLPVARWEHIGFVLLLLSRGSERAGEMEREVDFSERYRLPFFFGRVPLYRKNGTTTFVAHLRRVYRGGPRQWTGTIVAVGTSHNIP